MGIDLGMDFASITMDALGLRHPDGVGISPERLAHALGMSLAELASGAKVPLDVATGDPGSAPLQSHLHDLVSATALAAIISGDIGKAALWLRHEPIPAFRNLTGYQLVCAGRTDDLSGYLESIEAGFVG